jgi:hypothetical protein
MQITKFINAAFIPYVETTPVGIDEVRLTASWNTIVSPSQINTKVRLTDTQILDQPFIGPDYPCGYFHPTEGETPQVFASRILKELHETPRAMAVIGWGNSKVNFLNSQVALETAVNIKRTFPHLFVVLDSITIPLGVVKAVSAGLDGVCIGHVYEYSIQDMMALRQTANSLGSNIKLFGFTQHQYLTFPLANVFACGIDAIFGSPSDNGWLDVMARRGYTDMRSLVNNGYFTLGNK